MSDDQLVVGKIQYVIYYDDHSHFIVAKLKCSNPKQLITITGIMYEFNMNIEYEFYGDYQVHTKYGVSFRFKKYQHFAMSEEIGIIAYLSSDIFKGIGQKTATQIVKLLGKDTLKVLRENADILKKHGFRDNIIASIKDTLRNNDISNEIIQMREFGINQNILKLSKNKFGEKYLQLIQNNPYYVARHIKGFSLKIADNYAYGCQLKIDEVNRNATALYEEIRKILFNNGDCFLFLSEYNFANMQDELNILLMENLVVIKQQRLYLKPIYNSECVIVDFLHNTISENIIEFNVDNEIIKQEKIDNINYDSIQKDAINNFFSNNFLIITGGPGTGKTTITKAMIDIYRRLYPNKTITICAPTGKASKRIGDICNINATTIHRLLKWDLENEEFSINDYNPLDVDLLIIDEFSMVDTYLFASLLKASKNVEKVVLIGDHDQLPSIASGKVLSDLLSIDDIPRITLTLNHRQKNLSGIIELANDLNNLHDMNNYNNVHFIEDDYLEQFISTVKDKIANGYHDFQVLAAMYRGNYGIDNLNKLLQNTLNPSSKDKDEIKVMNQVYRVGDKVLQLKNQVDDNVYNGDIGIIIEIDTFYKKIFVDYDGNIVTYGNKDFENLTLGYCVSIHKAQGSEYSLLFLFLPNDHQYMFEKKLLYTAVTRAKKELFIFGDKHYINRNYKGNIRKERNTSLLELYESKKQNYFNSY